VTTRGGFGKHIWAAPLDGLEVYFHGLFIAEYLYTMSIVLVKWSILALYWRIFGSVRSTRLPIWILFGIVSAWGTAVVCPPPPFLLFLGRHAVHLPSILTRCLDPRFDFPMPARVRLLA
jgi:hypothetical protein